MMLEHLGFPEASDRVVRAMVAAIRSGATTPDLGGRATTEEVAEAVRRGVAQGANADF